MMKRLAGMGHMPKLDAELLHDYHEWCCDTGAESVVYECLVVFEI